MSAESWGWWLAIVLPVLFVELCVGVVLWSMRPWDRDDGSKGSE